MSIGIGGWADLVLEDDLTVMYQYGSYSWNSMEHLNEEHITDGLITIDRDCFAEPEIHEKIKRMPGGNKRLMVKRIPVFVGYDEMIRNGRIVIENCSNCWQTRGDMPVDIIASTLLHIIFREYQLQGQMLRHISFGK